VSYRVLGSSECPAVEAVLNEMRSPALAPVVSSEGSLELIWIRASNVPVLTASKNSYLALQ
jgi:hypothetical protein